MASADALEFRQVAPLFNAARNDPSPAVRGAALRALVRLPVPVEGKVAVGGLVWRLLEKCAAAAEGRAEKVVPSPLYEEIIDAAGLVPARQVRDTLRQILGGKDARIRAAAAHALARMGDTSCLGELVRTLNAPDFQARYQAAKDIYHLGTSAASFRADLEACCVREAYGSTRFWLALSMANLGRKRPLTKLLREVSERKCDLVEFWKDPMEYQEVRTPPAAAVPIFQKLAADAGVDPSLNHFAEDLLGLGQARPAPPPSPDRREPSESPGADEEKEIIAVLEQLASAVTDPDFPGILGLDDHLAELLDRSRGRHSIPVGTLFGYYQKLRSSFGPRMHVAWAVSRAPLATWVEELVSRLATPEEKDRVQVAELIELATRYRRSGFVPRFGGGGGPPDVREGIDANQYVDLDLGRDAGEIDPLVQSEPIVQPPPPPSPPSAPPSPVAPRSPAPPSSSSAPPPPIPNSPGPSTLAGPVRLGAAAPRSVRAGERFVAAFAAYVAELEEQVRRELHLRSRRSEPQLDLKVCRWKLGTEVKVVLTGRHLSVDPAADEFVWQGGRTVLPFEVAVDDEASPGSTVLKFNVYIADVRVAVLPVEIEIASEHETAPENHVHMDAPSTAFASYASADRLRVIDRVSEIRQSAGIDIFEDCLDLRPGEQWKPALKREIQKRDLFYLFWSANAQASTWVDWEWRTAFAEKGLDAMTIRPLQPVEEAPPPPELADLHFHDPLMIIRDHYAHHSPAGTSGASGLQPKIP